MSNKLCGAIYSRKSKFTTKGDSVENQVELCREHIEKYYSECMDIVVYEDEGFSGKDFDRPNFKKLLEDARNKRFQILFCYRLDRVSRNIADFTVLINELNALNISFVSIKEQFDTSTPMGRAMMYIASVFSQLERETIAERIKDNMYELAKTGRWLGGVTPTGFESGAGNEIRKGKNREYSVLMPKEEELEIIELIYNKYLELKSLSSVESFLVQNAVFTKNGKPYSRYTIKNILENPVYAKGDQSAYHYFTEKNAFIYDDCLRFNGEKGIMAFNKTYQVKSKLNKRNPVDKWIIALGDHKGLIEGSKWVEVQEVLSLNQNKRFRSPKTNSALFGGIIKCGLCGHYMRPKVYHTKNCLEPKFSYICELKEKSKKQCCNTENIRGRYFDELILQSILYIVKIEQSLPKIQYKQNEDEYNILQEKYQMNENKIKTLIKRIKFVDDDIFQELMEEINSLKQKNEEIKKQISKIQSAVIDNEADIEIKAQEVLDHYMQGIFDIPVKELSVVLKKIIKSITVGEGTAIITFQGEGDVKEINFPGCEYSKCYTVTMSLREENLNRQYCLFRLFSLFLEPPYSGVIRAKAQTVVRLLTGTYKYFFCPQQTVSFNSF